MYVSLCIKLLYKLMDTHNEYFSIKVSILQWIRLAILLFLHKPQIECPNGIVQLVAMHLCGWGLVYIQQHNHVNTKAHCYKKNKLAHNFKN